MSLFDNPRARNGGNSTSFVSTSNTGIMDITFGSTTDEEDYDTEQQYLNKMVNDTDRKVETVFGKGVDVWKSFNGTVYADVNDGIKRQRRDEEIWGKKKGKRKRATVEKEKGGGQLEQRFDSLRNLKSISGSGSTSTPTSEWEVFPVRQSQYDDFSGTPLEYKSTNNSDRTSKPLSSHSPRPQSFQTARTTSHQSTSPHSHPSSSQPHSIIPSPPADVFGNTIDGTRRIVPESFGSFDGGQVDRFVERRYRLLPEHMGRAEGNSGQDRDGDRDGKPDKLKGRPRLRKG
ncbi:hypothetical protein IG631_20275 [Alternaria alternata]|nr:hypothetical protein IG631_20275 [Alternaria alternata]